MRYLNVSYTFTRLETVGRQEEPWQRNHSLSADTSMEQVDESSPDHPAVHVLLLPDELINRTVRDHLRTEGSHAAKLLKLSTRSTRKASPACPESPLLKDPNHQGSCC
jgi:hypothetical protein